jgi:hypothetical protein
MSIRTEMLSQANEAAKIEIIGNITDYCNYVVSKKLRDSLSAIR